MNTLTDGFTHITRITPSRDECGSHTFNVVTPHGVLEAVEAADLLNKRHITAAILAQTGRILRCGEWWAGEIAEAIATTRASDTASDDRR